MRASPWRLLLVSLTVGCTTGELDRLSADYGHPAGASGTGGGAMSLGGAAGTGGVSAGAGGTSSSTGGTSAGGNGGAGNGGGAGGSGKAGSAGASGKAGASGASGGAGTAGASGASSCDGPMVSCTGCELCAESPTGTCAAETAACAKNPECGALQDCQNKCTDSMCATMCDEAHPMGVAAYTAYNSCGLMACTQACSTKLVCSGIPPGLTGACFAAEPCNPVTNKGCNAAIGEACDFDGMKFKCFGPPPANTVPLCGACDVDACKTGMFCLPTTVSGNAPKCVSYCCTDADCGPTGTCSMTFSFPEGGGCLLKLPGSHA